MDEWLSICCKADVIETYEREFYCEECGNKCDAVKVFIGKEQNNA